MAGMCWYLSVIWQPVRPVPVCYNATMLQCQMLQCYNATMLQDARWQILRAVAAEKHWSDRANAPRHEPLWLIMLRFKFNSNISVLLVFYLRAREVYHGKILAEVHSIVNTDPCFFQVHEEFLSITTCTYWFYAFTGLLVSIFIAFGLVCSQ